MKTSITSKEFYRTYVADPELGELNEKLIELIALEKPVHVLEFGCGVGKNLYPLQQLGICTAGLDLSFMNIIHAHTKFDLPCVIKGDETYLRNLCNFDVVFTCSVLDHIDDIDGIIQEFKRIANKSIFLMETNDVPGPYYYPHNYESYGFEKLRYSWKSNGDGATYHIWKLCVAESQAQ